MKTLLSILLALSISTLTFAQKSSLSPRHQLKIGLGTTYMETGKFTGRMQHLDYQFTIARPITIGLRGARTKALQVQEDGFEKSTLSYQVDADLMINILRNNTNAFRIGGGGSLRYAETALTAGDSLPLEGSIINRIQNLPENRHYGFSASLEYEVYIVKYISLGTRMTYAQYQNGDKVYYWGLSAGFRF